MKVVTRVSLYTLCFWHSTSHARGWAISLPEFIQTPLAVLFFLGILFFLIRKFTFQKIFWAIGFLILLFGIFSGKTLAIIVGAILSSIGFLLTISQKSSHKINSQGDIETSITTSQNTTKKIIEKINHGTNLQESIGHSTTIAQDTTKNITSKPVINPSFNKVNLEYFNNLDNKISENSFEWILEKDGVINIQTRKFIPKSQLREVEIDGVNGCLILDSFIYGVDFIPSYKIKII